MKYQFSSNSLNLVIFCSCAVLLSFGFYLELVKGLMPCPLCTFQRFMFGIGGSLALVAWVHNPKKGGVKIYSLLNGALFCLGAVLAGRQIYLQSLPPHLVPSCGPDLEYLLGVFPFFEVIEMVVMGDGSCAETLWEFLGLSIPDWSMISFFLLIGVCMVQTLIEKRNFQRII